MRFTINFTLLLAFITIFAAIALAQEAVPGSDAPNAIAKGMNGNPMEDKKKIKGKEHHHKNGTHHENEKGHHKKDKHHEKNGKHHEKLKKHHEKLKKHHEKNKKHHEKNKKHHGKKEKNHEHSTSPAHAADPKVPKVPKGDSENSNGMDLPSNNKRMVIERRSPITAPVV